MAAPDAGLATMSGRPDLRRSPLTDLRRLDLRAADRNLWADEAALWDRLQVSWAGLLHRAWPVPGAAASDAGGADWSLLDHVAHLWDWMVLASAYVDRVLEGNRWPGDADYEGGDFDRFNETRRIRWVGMTPDAVLAELDWARGDLIARVRRLDPVEVRSDAAWGWLFGALHGHVLDHLSIIEPWADRLRARQADGDPFRDDPRPVTLDAYWADEAEPRAAMDRLLSSVPERDWTVEPVTPRWSLRDHVGHLADWGEEGARAIETFRATATWPTDPEEGIDAWNERMVTSHRNEPPGETRARYRRAMQSLRAGVARLSLDELRDPEGWSWASGCLDGHLAKHLAMLGPWAARRAWPSEGAS
jgi:hypothetical protein